MTERRVEATLFYTTEDGARHSNTFLMPLLMIELGARAYHILATTRTGK